MSCSFFTDSSSDYAYLYGRVSGMTGKLLSAREIESLTQMTGAAEVLASLESTEYGKRLNELDLADLRSLDVEDALHQAFRDSFKELVAMVPDEERTSFREYFTSLWNHANTKAVIRGVHQKMSWDEIKRLINPLGGENMDRLSGMAAKETLGEALRLAGFFEEEGAETVYASYRESGRLELVEGFLDAAYFRRLAAALGGSVLAEYLSVYSDALNIKNIVRCAKYGIGPAPYLVGCGKELSQEVLSRASSAELAELPHVFSATSYAGVVLDAVREVSESGSFNALERGVEAILGDYLRDRSRLNPLSVYPAASYVELRLKEIKRLRAIILGKSAGLSPGRIRELVSEV